MSLILAAFLKVLAPTPDAVGLQKTAPNYLTVESAREHLYAAGVAADESKLDKYLVLAIASHESNYDAKARTAEPGGKTSCGVMTPIPKAVCVNHSLVDEYREGAEHIAGWLTATHGNMHQALLGVAGGYVLIKACNRGPVLKVRTNGRVDDICYTPEVFLWRAQMIKRSVEHERRVAISS